MLSQKESLVKCNRYILHVLVISWSACHYHLAISSWIFFLLHQHMQHMPPLVHAFLSTTMLAAVILRVYFTFTRISFRQVSTHPHLCHGLAQVRNCQIWISFFEYCLMKCCWKQISRFLFIIGVWHWARTMSKSLCKDWTGTKRASPCNCGTNSCSSRKHWWGIAHASLWCCAWWL